MRYLWMLMVMVLCHTMSAVAAPGPVPAERLDGQKLLFINATITAPPGWKWLSAREPTSQTELYLCDDGSEGFKHSPVTVALIKHGGGPMKSDEAFRKDFLQTAGFTRTLKDLEHEPCSFPVKDYSFRFKGLQKVRDLDVPLEGFVVSVNRAIYQFSAIAAEEKDRKSLEAVVRSFTPRDVPASAYPGPPAAKRPPPSNAPPSDDELRNNDAYRSGYMVGQAVGALLLVALIVAVVKVLKRRS